MHRIEPEQVVFHELLGDHAPTAAEQDFQHPTPAIQSSLVTK
jgi:hypothetical protein